MAASALAIVTGLLVAGGIVGVFVWFVLVSRFFTHLRTLHPSAYASIGSPTLLNNTPANSTLFLRYLLGRKYRQLADPALTKLGDAMVPFFWSYIAAFAVLIACVILVWRVRAYV